MQVNVSNSTHIDLFIHNNYNWTTNDNFEVKIYWLMFLFIFSFLSQSLAPLAEGQQAIVMVLCASIRSFIRPSVNSSFKKLLRNCWLDFYEISQECSLGGPLSNSFK